jgi:dolichol-phosphate mannosyltransferase
MEPIKKISVVVPMYNEAGNVEPLSTEIANSLKGVVEFEIVMVDDGSKDGTDEKLEAMKAKIPELRVITHKTNFGQSAGIISGAKAAKYPWLVTLDGDGQNDPADIPKLIKLANEHLDDAEPPFVAGNRQKRHDTPIRRISSRVGNGVRYSLLRDDCLDTGCSLKLFSRQQFLAVPHFNHLHRFLPAIFKRQGSKVYNIPVNHRSRTHGTSKYGINNRLWAGLLDLFGVMWLKKRTCNPKLKDQ